MWRDYDITEVSCIGTVSVASVLASGTNSDDHLVHIMYIYVLAILIPYFMQ